MTGHWVREQERERGMAAIQNLRVLVAEDDPEQLAALCAWVTELEPTWKIVAKADCVACVRRLIDEAAPDLLLLDIHMPDDEESRWIEEIDASVPIIYVTGDPKFAAQAFDQRAVDYLLKPLTLKRLKDALGRAAQDPRLAGKASAAADPVGADEPTLGDGSSSPGWLAMSRGAEVLVVPLTDILYLQADLKYTRVVSTRGEGLVRTSITELAQKFNAAQFVRIHRSVVVNMLHVASVRRNDLGQMLVHLSGRDEVLRVSKSFQQVFRTY